MIVVSSCSCLWPIHWSQVLSCEWRGSWGSADRRKSLSSINMWRLRMESQLWLISYNPKPISSRYLYVMFTDDYINYPWIIHLWYLGLSLWQPAMPPLVVGSSQWQLLSFNVWDTYRANIGPRQNCQHLSSMAWYMQDCGVSTALEMEIPQPCTRLSAYTKASSLMKK